jgi:hypothetical protein
MSSRRAGSDHVAGLELCERRAIGDQARNREDHLIDGRLLHHSAVDAGGELERVDVGNLVGGDHPGPESAGAWKILTGRVLRRVHLPVADAGVVIDGIAGDVTHGLLLGDMTAGPADDHGKLALIIELARRLGPQKTRVVPGLRIGQAQEDGRIRGHRASGLLAMRFVVEADAENLVGNRNHRKPFDLADRERRGSGGMADRPRGESAAQVSSQIDHSIAFDDSARGSSVDLEAG